MLRYLSFAGISNLMDGSGPLKCLDELFFLFLLIRKILFEKRVLSAKDHKVAKMYK